MVQLDVDDDESNVGGGGDREKLHHLHVVKEMMNLYFGLDLKHKILLLISIVPLYANLVFNEPENDCLTFSFRLYSTICASARIIEGCVQNERM